MSNAFHGRKETGRKVWLAMSLGVALVASGCDQKPAKADRPATAKAQIVVMDGVGRSVELATAPQRIVSLSAAATDILMAVGAHQELTGATRYCDVPAADEPHVTRIGGVADPDYERILALKPDLVVAPLLADKTLQEKIMALGLPLIVMHPEGLQGVLDDIRMIGQATGRKGAGEIVAQEHRGYSRAHAARAAGAKCRKTAARACWCAWTR